MLQSYYLFIDKFVFEERVFHPNLNRTSTEGQPMAIRSITDEIHHTPGRLIWFPHGLGGINGIFYDLPY